MRVLIAALCSVAAAFGAIDGTVTNQTSGKPQAGVTVTVMKLGQGMENLGSVKSDASGKFTLDKDGGTGAGFLVQALYDGITYNQIVQPGTPMSGLAVSVYDSSNKAGAARVANHMILLEPTGQGIAVSESVIWLNEGKTTFNDPETGSFKFHLPAGANGQVNIRATGPNGMPLQRPAEPTGTANVFKVNFPIRPGGETRFDLSYTLPAGTTYESKLLHSGPTRLVAPQGVSLTGENVVSLGPEPRTQATVYDVKGPNISVQIAGSGSLRAAEPAAGGEGDEGPGIIQSKPKIYERVSILLPIAFGILALGFALLYRGEALKRT